MKLQGIHHITAITADAPRNVDFYARALGLRLVKQTVNFDSPDVYHLYYGDERGGAGSILTFFEFPGAARGRAGAGMVHRIVWKVASTEALDFWAARLDAEGVSYRSEDGGLVFADPEGLELALTVDPDAPAALAAVADGIPPEHALRGFDHARAYAADPAGSASLLETLGLAGDPVYRYGAPPAERGRQGGGSVHHIAFASRDEDHEGWRRLAADAGAHVTPIVDRQYFESIYFREPSGVLFEIATVSPGFAVDEEPEHLGEALRLPPQHEHLRDRLERTLTPLPQPRGARSPSGLA